MLAAESIVQGSSYQQAIQQSWVWEELTRVRNTRPAFQRGLWAGLAYAALDNYVLRGKAPWTLHNHADYAQLKPANRCKILRYPRPDGKISLDKMTALQYANLKYTEGQPCHLVLANPQIAIEVNYLKYQSPEQRYCPAGVYEVLSNPERDPYLQINAANCLQCKACDIKDPMQNITWTPAEGGSGPNYTNM
jgi:electron-transferring-flavoprotein dehydrogenase